MDRVLRIRAMPALLAPWIAALMLACAGYGKVRPVSEAGLDIQTIPDSRLSETAAFYCGDPEAPRAVLFDVTTDRTRLRVDGWTPIEGKEQLIRMITAMRSRYRYLGIDARGPRLSEILDAGGRIIGYLYSPVDDTLVRPAGADYRVDAITKTDMEERADPGIKGAGA